MSAREHEMESDARDRAKEKEELDELRTKILAEGHEDPEGAFEIVSAIFLGNFFHDRQRHPSDR